MSKVALQNELEEIAVALRLHDIMSPAEFDAGLVHLEAEVERLALDAYSAQQRGLPLAEAAGDFVNYPHLARLHAAIDDILTMSLPPQLVSWVQSFLRMGEPPSLEGMRTAMVAAAANPQRPHRQALARFMLFEGVRLNLVMMTKWFPQGTFGVGLEMGDLDRIAEERVTKWLSEGLAVPNDVRPFHLIVSAALTSLGEQAEGLRATIANLQRDFVEAARRRAAIEELLAEMDVRDALLIRNEIAAGLGEQRLTVEHLQERHPLVLGNVSRNALDQRIRRIRRKPRQPLQRRRVALLDLLRHCAPAAGGA